MSGMAFGAVFKGKVVDADTGEPIEGAVVVAVWYEATATISGESTRLKDVKEALTDSRGEWVLEGPRGMWGGVMTAIYTFFTGSYYTRPPQFIVFKPGYCSWPKGFGIDSCRGRLKPSGNDKVAEGETVQLCKLTNREDRLRMQGIGPVCDGFSLLKKQREFIRLLNIERSSLGLSKIPVPEE